jgi:heme O synthase-like polyprenyltransferase
VSTNTVPTALRVTYLVLGWLTAVADAVFVIVLIATSADPAVVKHSEADKARGLFTFALIGALALLACHLIEKAEVSE